MLQHCTVLHTPEDLLAGALLGLDLWRSQAQAGHRAAGRAAVARGSTSGAAEATTRAVRAGEHKRLVRVPWCTNKTHKTPRSLQSLRPRAHTLRLLCKCAIGGRLNLNLLEHMPHIASPHCPTVSFCKLGERLSPLHRLPLPSCCFPSPACLKLQRSDHHQHVPACTFTFPPSAAAWLIIFISCSPGQEWRPHNSRGRA